MLTEIKIGTTVVKSFGYDAAGRRTSATYGGVTTTYAYDYESRITGITRTGTTANSFAYNGFDTRVSKTDSSGTTAYKRAGAYVTDPLLKSTVSSTTTDYTPGVSSRVSGDSTFLHSGIKNADEQTDDGGDISASRQYDAFGNLVSSSGPWAGPFGYGGPYGYQSDPDHGLMLLGHRYCEAETGRFLTRDPIKDGRNWFGYCGGGPVTRVDPTGLEFDRESLKRLKKTLDNLWRIHPGGRAAHWGNNPAEYRRETPGTVRWRNRGGDWRTAPLWTDCGTFVGKCMIVFDPDFPRSGCDIIYNYLIDNELYLIVVGAWESGDVAVDPTERYPNGSRSGGHAFIRGNDGHWYKSSLGDTGTPRRRTEEPGPNFTVFRLRRGAGG